MKTFINLYIPPSVGKAFKFMVFTFLENALNLCIFTHAPAFPKQERMVKTMICFIKIQSEKCKDEMEH